tara:strand:+ start:2866 stop:3618 length:753 start_codon:yes stop_codon:yes gene_type:complete
VITFAIPNYNRIENVYELCQHHNEDERISEIVICDDHSDIQVLGKVADAVHDMEKVKLFRNDKNVGPFLNKVNTVFHSTNEWVILCDSDNFISKDYVDKIFEQEPWNVDTLYCPDFAKPAFDYTGFSGKLIDNKESLSDVYLNVHNGACFLNTGNFFFNRQTYLDITTKCTQFCADKHACDVVAFNYFWVFFGNKIQSVKDLQYDHDHNSGDSVWRKFQSQNKHHDDLIRKMMSGEVDVQITESETQNVG